MRNCVKCLGSIDSDEFVVNKHMAYCEDCGRMLHLGESKESKPLSAFHITGRRPPPEELEVPALAGGPEGGETP